MRGRWMDKRETFGELRTHLRQRPRWRPDGTVAQRGPAWRLSCPSRAEAPGCRGTWTPWEPKWSRPRPEPGTELACCRPAEESHKTMPHIALKRMMVSPLQSDRESYLLWLSILEPAGDPNCLRLRLEIESTIPQPSEMTSMTTTGATEPLDMAI